MANAKTIEELRGMSTEELIRAYDSHARNTSVGTQFYMDEIVRRAAKDQADATIELNRQVVRLNKQLTVLTWIIMLLTLVSAAAAVLMFFKA